MKHFQYIFALFALILIFAATQKSQAATFTVTNTNDSGAGSLRQAMLAANSNSQDDTIEFDQSIFNTPRTITLTSGELTIEADDSSGVIKLLTINGPGANLLTLNGNNQSRVIYMGNHSRAVINKVKITGGNAAQGAGIMIASGYVGEGLKNLILADSIVTGNSATYGGGISGGGFEIVIVNSTISGNTAVEYGGGIYISFTSHFRIFNSTVSKNTAGAGGGIHSQGGNLHLTNCTVAFNQAQAQNPVGGGIYLGSASTSFYSSMDAVNSIISKNTGGFAPNIYGSGFTSRGTNIIGSNDGFVIGASTDQINAEPALDPDLRNNGGVVPTHALNIGSPAIDRGNNCVLIPIINGGCSELLITTDQRGIARPQDGDSNGTATVDIGAFEVSAAEISAAPSTPDLRAASDTGVSNTDNLTRSHNLIFDINGLTVGATIEFLRNGSVIDTTTAVANSLNFTDNTVLDDGTYVYSVRQIINGATSLQNSVAVTIDGTAPLVFIDQADTQAGVTRNQPINFKVAVNEQIPGFTASNVSLVGSTAGVGTANIVVTGGNRFYNVAVSNITSDGEVRASIPPNGIQDFAGNGNVISYSIDNTVILDTTPPTVTINQAATQADPTRNSTVNFTVVFSEIVNGFSSTGIQLLGSTANYSNAFISVTGSGTTYNVAISNLTSNGGFIRPVVVPSAAIDLASNPNGYSTSTDNTVVIDNTSPTVTINQAATQVDPTANLPINYTVVFSEPVTGFDSADVALTSSNFSVTGAVITVTGSGTTYNVAVSNIAANNGLLRASVRSSAASDALGNLSVASTSTDNTVAVDNIAPTVSINQAIGQSDPATSQPINFTVVFSELVSGFTASDISLSGSTANISSATIVITGSGNVYNVAVSNVLSSGLVRASVIAGAAQDAAGNLSTVSTSSDNTVAFSSGRSGAFDFDGDRKSDLSVFRPDNGTWYLQQSSTGFAGIAFGLSTDKLVPADYDGDGKTDVAVYRGGVWYMQRSQAGFTGIQFGDSNDIPVPADYDGDGKAELAVFRPSNGYWYVLNLTNNQFTSTLFGISTDKPVPADYDGDGRADIAVNRNGNWYIQRSQLGFIGIQFGTDNDRLVPADYDGDGKADVAVFRPSNGTWYLLQSTAGFAGIQFGLGTDIPVAADYDGDGRADVAVVRNGNWYLNRTTNGFIGVQFGTSTDLPVPSVFVR